MAKAKTERERIVARKGTKKPVGAPAPAIRTNGTVNLVSKVLLGKRVEITWQEAVPDPRPPVQDMLLAVMREAPSWSDRHHPTKPAPNQPSIVDGTRCMYIACLSDRAPQPGVYFEVGSYIHGQAEDQITLDLDQPEPDVVNGPLQGQDGKLRSILHTFRCVAVGETLLVHNERGGGGMDSLSRYLTHLFRRHGYPRIARIRILDVFSPGLREAIEAGGGPKSIKLDIIGAVPERIPEDQTFGAPLACLKKLFPGSRKASTTVAAPTDLTLAIEEVESAYNESQQTGSVLDKVSIDLIHGRISSLGKFLCKGECQVEVTGRGLFNKDAIRLGLYTFLDDLRMPHDRDFRLIDEDGYFPNRAPVSTP